MAQWDFKHHHVQKFENAEVASQLGAKAILISVGPARFNPNAHAVVMGFVQNLSFQQQRQILELFEIGSERRYFIDNPHRNAVQFSRALVSGPSVLKILGSGILNQGIMPGDNTGVAEGSGIFTEGDINAVAAHPDNNFWINLASDLFNMPLGIMLSFREFHGDGSSSDYGTIYLEMCKVQGHGFSVNAQMWLLQEDVSILFEHVVPLSGGAKVQDSYKKREEIMRNLGNVKPEWFDQYVNWTGRYTG